MIFPNLKSGLFALAGAFVASIGHIAISWITQRAEERKHVREIAIRMAIKSWKLNFKTYGSVGPLEHQLIYSALITGLATEKNLTPKRMKKRLDEIEAIMRVAVDHSYHLRDRVAKRDDA